LGTLAETRAAGCRRRAPGPHPGRCPDRVEAAARPSGLPPGHREGRVATVVDPRGRGV